MKVVIGPYRNWIGPYQIAEMLCWWVPKIQGADDWRPRKPDWVHEFGTWLSQNSSGEDSWLTRVCQWVEARRHRQVYIRIDKYDSWSADHTLALIAVPLLRQLQTSKHGAPFVDDSDVPDELKSTNAPAKENEHDTDANHFKRWDWVLAEIIWALEQKTSDTADSDFYSRLDPDLKSKDFDAMMNNIVVDYTGLEAWQARKTNGYRLFGKYFENLWD